MSGETEVDLSIQKEILQKLTPEIVHNLEPGELIDCLFANDIISVNDKEEIECEMKKQRLLGSFFNAFRPDTKKKTTLA